MTGETRKEERVAMIGAERGERAMDRVGRWMSTYRGGG